MSYDYWDGKQVSLEELKGKVFVEIKKEDDKLTFRVSDTEFYVMEHHQSCCESVYIEDITGDLDDLLFNPILHAEETGNSGDDADGYGTYTWTFYKLATVKGWVDIRWYGSSNGYYSEEVELTYYNTEEIAKAKGYM